MRRRSLMVLAVGLALAFGGPVAVRASELVPPATADYELHHVDVQTAAGALWGLAGTLGVEIVSERQVRVTDTPAVLEVATRVIALLDVPPTAEPAPFSVPFDDTRVEAFGLQSAPLADAVKALRLLGIAKIAAVASPPRVIVRDTPQKVETARAMIALLEARCP